MGGFRSAVKGLDRRALGRLEFHALVLIEAAVPAGVGERGEVDEDVRSAAVDLDEAEALLGVEPLHSSLCHGGAPFKSVGRPALCGTWAAVFCSGLPCALERKHNARGTLAQRA